MNCKHEKKNGYESLKIFKQIVTQKNKEKKSLFCGFTLVELLAVIVILALIALIATPMIMNQIETVREKAFIESAKNTLDAGDIYIITKNEILKDGTDIQELTLKGKENYKGYIFQNNNGQYILKNFTDGKYCASGTKNQLVVRKENCGEEGNLYASLSLSIKEKTTRKITVLATATDDTGISGYSYCVADCEKEDNWKTSEQNEYTFDSLTYSKKYEIHVRVTNQIDKVTEKSVEVTTENLPVASYAVSPSGWATNKTVTITYPNELENYVIVHSGQAKLNGEIIVVGERKKITGSSVEVTFETNGTIEAITSDGYNEASPSTLTVSQIDTTVPVVNSLSIASTNGSYNVLTTTITSNVTDNSGATIQMYISNSGYETGGSWETYAASKAWNVGGSLTGGTRTVYITYKDQAGNKINKTVSYAVYNECGSGNTTTSYGTWGSCSKTCGSGTQSRNVTVTDNKTGKTCSTSTGTQACNTQSCETILYNSGIDNTSLTGGWTGYNATSGAYVASLDSSYISVGDTGGGFSIAMLVTKKPINLTSYNTITVTYQLESYSGPYGWPRFITVISSETTPGYGDTGCTDCKIDGFYDYQSNGSTLISYDTRTLNLNVSNVTGSWYLAVGGRHSYYSEYKARFRVTKIVLK